MAGAIVGRFNRNGKPVEKREIMKMLSLLGADNVHREGLSPEEDVGLGQMSLPIKMNWEENPGPVWDREKKLAVTANAFLLNREELLRQLSVSPDQYKQTGNNELILMAYERWDTRCPEKLVGNFAFALWDSRQKRLFCARSHLGNSTFCYYLNEKTCVFATEVKSVLAASGVGAQLNPSYLCDFVLGLHNDPESTAFEGVNFLPPAHAMLIESSRHRIWKYWDLKDSPHITFRNPGEYCEAANELLEKIVRGHLVTEEKTGLHIRGNMESAALASIATPLMRQQGKEIFSVSYALGKDYKGQCRDDSAYTREIEREYGLNVEYVTEKTFPPPFDEVIEKKFFLLDSPEGNTFGSDHNVIYGAMQRQGVKALLTEATPKIGVYRPPGLMDFAMGGQWQTFRGELREMQRISGKSLPRAIAGQVIMPFLPDSFYHQWRQYRNSSHYQEKAALIHEEMRLRLGVYDRVRQNDQSRRQRTTFRENLIQSYTGLPDAGKKYMSAKERSHGFLIHSPFSDKRLLEFLIGISGNHDRTPDVILRRALKGKIPENIRVNPVRASYPADLPDRRISASTAILRELDAIKGNDKVWEYIDQGKVREMIHQIGRGLDQPMTWRTQTPQTLVRVILLQRFLQWATTAFKE